MSPWRKQLYVIIFQADTPEGRLFDLILLFSIIISVIIVMLESVGSLKAEYGTTLRILEWTFTGLFTLEYIARVISLNKPRHYILSFYGLIDLFAVLPTYLSLLFVGTQALAVIRIFRLLRVFRILKLVRFLGEANHLFRAVRASLPKITVFLITVICVVAIMGTAMYIIEGPEHGFTSIPVSIYWTVVTITTVGYGDIAPQTPLGQVMATCLMIMGYGLIAVPTGIVTEQLYRGSQKEVSTKVCPNCTREGHTPDAQFCKFCGHQL